MKLCTFILIVSLMQVNAASFSQTVTLKEKGISLEKVFREIRTQTGYNVLIGTRKLQTAQKMDADFSNVPLNTVLEKVVSSGNLSYTITDKTIIIKDKQNTLLGNLASVFNNIEVEGIVFDEKGSVKDGVTVRVKGSGKVVYTDRFGKFVLKGIAEDAILLISHIGYSTIEEPARGTGKTKVIRLKLAESPLDEVQVMAYGETSRRKATGNITTVSGDDLRAAPTANPILALQGLVPGLVVTQSSGMPGSNVKLQIRGKTRIDKDFGADDNPLVIVDGVPLPGGTGNMNQIASAIEGLSPFNGLNAGDIESIEVLKDADATAIYGSRGASGVILITTKKAKSGPVRINVDLSSGISKSVYPEMLSTAEYLTMRKEAFKNDNIVITNANAYDVLQWDTTRTSNVVNDMLGSNSSYTNLQTSISGGDERVSFNLSSGYNRQTVPLAERFPNTRINLRAGVSTRSANKKISADFRFGYDVNRNRAPISDITKSILNLAPYYKYFNEDGSIAWNEGGRVTNNPLNGLYKPYDAKTTSLSGNTHLKYRMNDNLSVKANVGYQQVLLNEVRSESSTSGNPAFTMENNSNFGNSELRSLIAEPQLEYIRPVFGGQLTLLAGGTLQLDESKLTRYAIYNYSSDDYLGTLIGVNSGSFRNNISKSSEYKYLAGFARLSYDYEDKYIVNISARRDGSSRFGPGYKFGNFGAIGASWLISNEDFMRNQKIFSFAKLRGSYGVNGNDKIGDYKFLDLYEVGLYSPSYNGLLSMSPTALYRNDLHWEVNKQLEFAVELGLFKDRMLFSAAYYQRRTYDPLVMAPLPGTTGFPSVASNLDEVIVQNNGLEITLDYKNIDTKDFSWRTAVNFTVPQNKLISYPGLEKSIYSRLYQVGKSLNMLYLAKFLGVDPQTGLAILEDTNGSGKFQNDNYPLGDRTALFDLESDFYGGIQNTLRYKLFTLRAYMYFNKQWIANWRLTSGDFIGSVNAGNMPVQVLDRWQKPGDITDVPKYSTNTSSALTSSNAAYDNLFYLTMQTLELNYTIAPKIVNRLGLNNFNIYGSAQNLFTIVPFGEGIDQNAKNSYKMAPLRTFVLGLRANF